MLALALLLGLTLAHAPHLSAQPSLHTLTSDDNNTTLTVPVGDSIELRLPTDKNWDVQITNPGVLTRPPIALVRGVQGFWNASAPGESVITANGRPQCDPGAICPQFIVHFQATIDVVASGNQAAGQTTAYAAGWNLVAGLPGGDLSAALPPLFTLQPGDSGYVAVQPAAATKPGYGYWAYFPSTTTLTLPAGTNSPYSVRAPAGQYIMIADPSGTQPAIVSGADAVYTYTPAASYQVSARLTPGQGAWALYANGGIVTVTPRGEVPTMPPATPLP